MLSELLNPSRMLLKLSSSPERRELELDELEREGELPQRPVVVPRTGLREVLRLFRLNML